MIFFIVNVMLLLFIIFFTITVWKKYKNIQKIDTITLEKNKQIKQDNEKLKKEEEYYINNISLYQSKLDTIIKTSEAIKNSNFQNKETANESFIQYVQILDNNYNTKEKEYDDLIQSLYNAYNEEQENLLNQIKEEQNKLEDVRSSRIAAIEAQTREKQIKEQLSFYCLQLGDNDKDDIRALERVKPNLHQPRILCMLIWSTYFQKPMTALCNNILGTAIVCGVYKITNQETGECYIGQAVDVAKRWKDHAKCGLGIDTPANNKLYKAIQEYGIWNFSWELLEKCDKEQLNEKEKFYIELYQSKDYGYNSSAGIKKGLLDKI